MAYVVRPLLTMPWFRVAQPLKRYSFKGPQEIFKVLLTRNVSVLSEQPTSEAGNPGNILQGDDAIVSILRLSSSAVAYVSSAQ